MKTKEQIRDLFLDRFRITRCKADQGFMVNQLYAVRQMLTPQEYEILIDRVLPEMEEEGIFTFDNNFFRLTETGYDSLYTDMKTEYEIADIIFDVCKEFGLKSDQVVKWITVTERLRKTLNSRELNLAWLVVDKLCRKEYIRLETSSGNRPQWLRLLELGYDYMYDNDTELDLSVPTRLIPDGVDIASDEAFNSMWEWVGEKDAPKYQSGSQLYQTLLSVDKNLPPYQIFLNKRRDAGQDTTRKVWLYEQFQRLTQAQKKDFFTLMESLVNRVEPRKGKEAQADALMDWDVPEPSPVPRPQAMPRPAVGSVAEQSEKEQDYHPSVFISYSWDDEPHKQWVLDLADRLSQNGIYVYLDRYDLGLGREMTHFMENALEKADRILVIGTPKYKEKADGRVKGVGFEHSIIAASMMNDLGTDRFIPILRVGPKERALPLLLQGRIGAFMDKDEDFEKEFENLVREIHGSPAIQRPALGPVPEYCKK
jgi:SEFIR domain family